MLWASDSSFDGVPENYLVGELEDGSLVAVPDSSTGEYKGEGFLPYLGEHPVGVKDSFRLSHSKETEYGIENDEFNEMMAYLLANAPFGISESVIFKGWVNGSGYSYEQTYDVNTVKPCDYGNIIDYSTNPIASVAGWHVPGIERKGEDTEIISEYYPLDENGVPLDDGKPILVESVWESHVRDLNNMLNLLGEEGFSRSHLTA
jgi:hypothetical protein